MKRTLPPTYFFGAMVLSVALHLLLPLHQLLVFPGRLIGLVPLLVGIVLNLLADQAFKKHNTTVKPFETSSALITGGVFGISRNPMYLGMIAVLSGLVLLIGSASPWLVVVLLFLILNYRFIRTEESMLREAFGEEFGEYCRNVRRWV